jgi:hypothetical protein
MERIATTRRNGETGIRGQRSEARGQTEYQIRNPKHEAGNKSE